MMDSIVDYQKSDKTSSVSGHKMVHRSWSFMRRSTAGCHLCVQWRDGYILWQALKDVKESHPVETVEYSMAQEIYHNPAFNWWVKAALNNKLGIISLFNKSNAR